MTRKERLQYRNKSVRELFEKLSAKHPQWRVDAIIEEVAKKFFLSNRTVEAIIGYEGIYNDVSVANSVSSSQMSLF